MAGKRTEMSRIKQIGKRTEMSKIKQILLLHKDGMSNRKIGERLGLYKETVNNMSMRRSQTARASKNS